MSGAAAAQAVSGGGEDGQRRRRRRRQAVVVATARASVEGVAGGHGRLLALDDLRRGSGEEVCAARGSGGVTRRPAEQARARTPASGGLPIWAAAGADRRAAVGSLDGRVSRGDMKGAGQTCGTHAGKGLYLVSPRRLKR